MKRFLPALIILIVLVGITGCQVATQNTAQNTATESLDIVAVYNTAAEAYAWFDMTTMPLDAYDSRQEGDRVYNRVKRPGITSMAELKDYLNTLFTPELTESLLALSPDRYKDFDGVLYAQGADRGSNLYLQDKQVDVKNKDDTHWEVTLTFYADYTDDTDPAAPQVTIGYSQSVLNFEKTDAGLRFTSFCPTDNLNLDADTVYTFTYNSDTFGSTDFDAYGGFQLCCYLLNADGAFAEWPSDLLAHRFLTNPKDIISALAIVKESPWKNEDSIIPSVGYCAAAWFTDAEQTEFEAILNSDTAAESSAEHRVLNAISAAYNNSVCGGIIGRADGPTSIIVGGSS